MKYLIFIASLIHRAGSAIRSFFYGTNLFKTKKAPIKIISIGNLSFGGSGKTPLAISIARFLNGHDRKICLVTRGYKGKWEKSGGVLSDGKNVLAGWREAGDEPYMAALNLPETGILVGKNRLKSCKLAINMGFNIVLLDDGFQHLKLHRDMNIVLFDPEEKILLRESWSALKRADIILIKNNLSHGVLSTIKKKYPKALVYPYHSKPTGFFGFKDNITVSPQHFFNKKVLAICAIANPGRFLTFLDEQNIFLLHSMTFPDHHPYPESTRRKILNVCERLKIEIIITTEKDKVKIDQLAISTQIPIYFLKMDIHVQSEFYQEIWDISKEKRGL